MYLAAMDPSLGRNAWTLAIAGLRKLGNRYRASVVLTREWRATGGSALDPAAILETIAGVVRPYGVQTVMTDQWHAKSMQAICVRLRLGIGLAIVKSTAARTPGAVRVHSLPVYSTMRSTSGRSASAGRHAGCTAPHRGRVGGPLHHCVANHAQRPPLRPRAERDPRSAPYRPRDRPGRAPTRARSSPRVPGRVTRGRRCTPTSSNFHRASSMRR